MNRQRDFYQHIYHSNLKSSCHHDLTREPFRTINNRPVEIAFVEILITSNNSNSVIPPSKIQFYLKIANSQLKSRIYCMCVIFQPQLYFISTITQQMCCTFNAANNKSFLHNGCYNTQLNPIRYAHSFNHPHIDLRLLSGQ